MTALEYTAQQDAAIKTRDVSVALSAGAGCGKTFVLTQRFLDHLRPGPAQVDLQRIVAITFTDRAAREMRDRIRAACRKEIDGGDAGNAAYWQSVVRGLDAARISTIHSFCTSLLRSHAVEAGLDPRFGLLDGPLGGAFLRNAVRDAVHELLAKFDDDCVQLVYRYGLDRAREMLAAMVRECFGVDLARFAGHTPESLAAQWLQTWQARYVPRLLQDLADSPLVGNLRQLLAEHDPDHKTMRARCRFLADALPTLPQADDPQALLADLRKHARVQGGGGKSAWPDPDVYCDVKHALEALRSEIKNLQKLLDVSDDDLHESTRLALIAGRLTQQTAASYAQAKRDAALLDFDDLLVRARDLLRDRPAVCRRAAAGIDVLLVDEFQDTDPVQAEIVRLLCGERLTRGKLFLVGDAKQSIYGFRRADPHVFTELRSEIPEPGRLPLTTNFRSQPAVLAFVNAVFSGRLAAEERLQPHDPRQHSPPPSIEFLFATPPPTDDARQKPSAADLRRLEAEWIARRVCGLLADETPRVRTDGAADQSRLRRVRPGDVVILFRALSNVQDYEAALRKYGLEYYLVGGRAFYAQQEVFDLVNLCTYLDCPDDPVSLLGVLRSPFFSIADETLYALAGHGRRSLHAALHEPPDGLDPERRRQLAFARDVLDRLRQDKDRVSIAQLLAEAVDETGYDAALLAEYLGHRKVANLRKLIDLADEFDETGLFTLSDFVQRLRDSVADQTDEELAATHAEQSDVIRLMTIHQAKGLEFPVVIVADMDRKGPPHARQASLHPELGPLLSLPKVQGDRRDNLGQRMHRLDEQRRDEEETRRLLYVALTRAADHLILSAGFGPGRRPTMPWTKLIAERFDLNTGLPTHDPYQGAFLGGDAEIPDVLMHQTIPRLPPAGKLAARPARLPLDEFRDAVAEAEPIDLPATYRSIPPDARGPRFFSVSRIEEAAADSEKPTAAPVGAVGAERAADLGTLVHAVLERIDFHHAEQIPGLVATCAVHLRSRQDGLEATAANLVSELAASDFAAEVCQARRQFRELDFLLDWPAAGFGSIVSGTIDLLYQSAAGTWHVADYKTGASARLPADEALAHYEIQLGVYALAVQQLLGRLPDSVELIMLETPVRRVRFDATEKRLAAVTGRVTAVIETLRRGAEARFT